MNESWRKVVREWKGKGMIKEEDHPAVDFSMSRRSWYVRRESGEKDETETRGIRVIPEICLFQREGPILKI